MSYNNHRRPTPVPSDHIHNFGRDYAQNKFQLPAISESPPERKVSIAEDIRKSMDAAWEEGERKEAALETRKVEEGERKLGEDEEHRASAPLKSEIIINVKDEEKEKVNEIDPLIISYNGPSSGVYAQCSIASFGESKQKIILPTPTKELVPHALLALFFSVFNIIWSLGAYFWHLGEGKKDEAALTIAVAILAALIVEIFYVFNSHIAKKKIWRESKLLWLIFLIPGSLPVFMALSNLVFAAKEQHDPQYVRLYYHTELIFLVESLALALPQCVLQLTILMEDYTNFPSLKWGILGMGLFICTLGISFARIRFDSARKSDQFGLGLERYIRYLVVGSSKILWIVTLASLVVSVRIGYGRENIRAVVVAVGGLTICYELPMLFFSIRACRGLMAALMSIFFLLPQFAALICHILWVNLDKTVFVYNIGGFILGVFFSVESLCLAGWLLDRCTGHDLDFMSCYPHLFGNVFKKCFKSKQTKS